MGISPKMSQIIIHDNIKMCTTDDIHMQDYLNKFLFFKWGIDDIDKMICFEMAYYYHKKSEDFLTEFISFVKDIDIWEP